MRMVVRTAAVGPRCMIVAAVVLGLWRVFSVARGGMGPGVVLGLWRWSAVGTERVRLARGSDGNAEIVEPLAQRVLARGLAVELDADRAPGVGLGLHDARHLVHPLGDGPRAPLVAESLRSPHDVAVPLGEPCASGLGGTAKARQRDDGGVVVQAELRGVAVLGRDHVRPLDARGRGQRVGQARHAGIARVRRVGEEDGEVEAEGVGHERGRARREGSLWRG